MSKVVVDAGGRRVEIEHEVSTPAQLGGLIRRAHGLWERTAPTERGSEAAGPAYGFQAERRPSVGYEPVGGRYGSSAPVTA